jgi:hypothetical protein
MADPVYIMCVVCMCVYVCIIYMCVCVFPTIVRAEMAHPVFCVCVCMCECGLVN